MRKTDWEHPEFFSHDGLRFAFWETGPKDSLYPTLVFSHGFPELAYSWRFQMQALGDAGFHCVTMDQRGYGLTDCPDAVDAYTMEKLCGDMEALCAHLDLSRVIFCGHDWGGLIVWQMPLRHPERCAGVISLNTPYTKRAPTEPIALYRRRFGENFYIVWFQEDGEAEALFEADIRKTLTYFSQCPPEPQGGTVDQRQGSSLKDTLETFEIAKARPCVMDDESFDYYVRRFEKTGFRGAVNWYRNFDRNWHASEGQTDRVELPCLMIMAERDPVLPPSATEGMERYVPMLDRVLIKGSGHWTQQEKPEDTNAAISNWVRTKFPV